jgi:hypothetical protein
MKTEIIATLSALVVIASRNETNARLLIEAKAYSSAKIGLDMALAGIATVRDACEEHGIKYDRVAMIGSGMNYSYLFNEAVVFDTRCTLRG